MSPEDDVVACPRCGGSGWVCERHPADPIDHMLDSGMRCLGPGLPCPICNNDPSPRLPKGFPLPTPDDGS